VGFPVEQYLSQAALAFLAGSSIVGLGSQRVKVLPKHLYSGITEECQENTKDNYLPSEASVLALMKMKWEY
jgi:hypothetical protein